MSIGNCLLKIVYVSLRLKLKILDILFTKINNVLGHANKKGCFNGMITLNLQQLKRA